VDGRSNRQVERRTISRRQFGILAVTTATAAATGGTIIARDLQRGKPPPIQPVPATPSPVPLTATLVVPTPHATSTAEPPPKRTSLSNENQMEGDPDWLPTRGTVGGVAGFASPRSVVAGESVALHIAGSAGVAAVSIFRVGWYGGAGARRLLVLPDVQYPSFALHVDDMRMVHADWGASVTVPIPVEWTSGVYVARVDAADGQHLIPFWVKSPGPRAPILVLSGLATYAAYSAWGGYSLYATDAADGLRAHAVSLDRPFNRNWGAGDLLTWEYQFIRWFEGAGFDADYACDIDLDEPGDLLSDRRLVVLPGHHEYYTNAMREALEGAVASGANLAVLGANAMYWRIRLTDSTLGTRRNVVCFKDSRLDQDAGNPPTVRFRDEPDARPEAAFLGVQYEQTNSFIAPWKVYDSRHWAFNGTGLADGDAVEGMIGPEYDRVVPGVSPPTTEVLAQSPVVNDYGEAALSHSTISRHPSGGAVFASGSLNFTFALDPYRIPRWRGVGNEDERVKRFLTNIFERFSAP